MPGQRKTAGSSRKNGGRSAQSLEGAAASASAAVREAASVLERELAAGLAGVRRVETRFTQERRVDPGEFDEVLERFRSNAHELIDVASARVTELGSDDVADLSKRLTRDAHDLFDVALDMFKLAPDAINRLVAKGEQVLPEPTDGPPQQPKPRSTRGPRAS
jgi:hypothetical protein